MERGNSSICKRITFNMQDGLEGEIRKLTVVMSQLAARSEGVNRQFKPKIHQGWGRGQTRNYYNNHNCNRWSYQDRYRSVRGDRRNQYRQNTGRPRYEQEYRRKNIQVIWGHIKILSNRIEEIIEAIIGMRIILEKEVVVGLEKDHFWGMLIIEGMI